MGPRRGGSHLSPETRRVSESCGPKLSQRPEDQRGQCQEDDAAASSHPALSSFFIRDFSAVVSRNAPQVCSRSDSNDV